MPNQPGLHPRSLLLAATLCLPPIACSSLQVTLVNSEQKKPNNVWMFFTIEKGDEPVGGLEADDFEIYEDDQLVSKFESKQTIQNPEVAAVMYTLLLLDMSGSVTESGEVDALVDSAKTFSDRVGKSQKVGVYAFDGSEEIYSVVGFTETAGSVEGGLEGLRGFKAKDPSTNLNGAVVLGLEELEAALAKDDRPLKFGTLVVFTDGTDRAARVSHDELTETLGGEAYQHYEMYAIGVGAEIEEKRLGEIGKDGAVLVEDRDEVQTAFEDVAARIENHMKRFYLLSYCTPARSGDHSVRIVANLTEKREGKKDRKRGKGAVEYAFNADGFGPPPDCDPNRQPSFPLDEIPAPETEEETPSRSRTRGKRSSRGSIAPPGGG